MSPEQAAKDLVLSYQRKLSFIDASGETILLLAKDCARIAVNELIHATWKEATYKKQGFVYVDERTTQEYWRQVRNEIDLIENI